MRKEPAPSDPQATFVEDGESLPDLSSEPTGMLPVNDATFRDLPPASPSLTALAEPDGSIAILQPVKDKLDAAEIAARSTLTSEPDPTRRWRLWLASPASRNFRFGSIALLGLTAAWVLAFLFTPKATAPAMVPVAKRSAPAEPPAPEKPLEPRAAIAVQPAMFADVVVDGGGVEKRPAGLIKVSTSPVTEVTVNGEKLGSTPVYVTALAGRVELALESHDPFIHKVVVIELVPGNNSPRSWELAQGWVDITAPVGSAILIDGRAVGTAPVGQQALYEGYHRVEVVRPDKTKAVSRVDVKPRFTLTHFVE